MMNDALLKTQRNSVLRLIKQQGLDASEFQWETKQETTHGVIHHTISVLVHRPSGFYFEFGAFESRYSPGEGQMTGRIDRESWDSRLGDVGFWLHRLHQEVTAPDLWATIIREKAFIEAVSRGDADNRPFSSEERRYIAAALDQIKGQLSTTLQLQHEQAKLIDDRLQYLEQASNRLGRKDWLNIAIGVLFNIVISGAFSPERAKAIFHLVISSLQPLFNELLKLAG